MSGGGVVGCKEVVPAMPNKECLTNLEAVEEFEGNWTWPTWESSSDEKEGKNKKRRRGRACRLYT